MNLLNKKDRKTFLYKGYEYTFLGTFLDEDDNKIFGKITWKNIEQNTPKGYTWEDFNNEAKKNGVIADIYLFNNIPVVPIENGICDYRVSVPDSCKTNNKII